MSIENGENGYALEEKECWCDNEGTVGWDNGSGYQEGCPKHGPAKNETQIKEAGKQNSKDTETNQNEEEENGDDQEETMPEVPKHEWENIIHGMVHRQEKDYRRRIVDKIILLHNDRQLSEFVKPSPENEDYRQPTPVNNKEIGLAKEAKKEFGLSVEIPEPIYGTEVLSQDEWCELLKEFDMAWKKAEIENENSFPLVKMNINFNNGTYYTKSKSNDDNFLSIEIRKGIGSSRGSSGGGDLTTEKRKEFQELGFTDKEIDAAEEAHQKWSNYMEKTYWEPNRKKEAQERDERKQFLIDHFGLNNN